MKIELSENEMVVLNRIHQLYYDGMYHDLYENHGTEFPCDKYCEEFMKTSIEDIVSKINNGNLQK